MLLGEKALPWPTGATPGSGGSGTSGRIPGAGRKGSTAGAATSARSASMRRKTPRRAAQS